jgi:hypothetical protein
MLRKAVGGVIVLGLLASGCGSQHGIQTTTHAAAAGATSTTAATSTTTTSAVPATASCPSTYAAYILIAPAADYSGPTVAPGTWGPWGELAGWFLDLQESGGSLVVTSQENVYYDHWYGPQLTGIWSTPNSSQEYQDTGTLSGTNVTLSINDSNANAAFGPMRGDYIGTVTCSGVSLTQVASVTGAGGISQDPGETYLLKPTTYADFEKATGA